MVYSIYTDQGRITELLLQKSWPKDGATANFTDFLVWLIFLANSILLFFLKGKSMAKMAGVLRKGMRGTLVILMQNNFYWQEKVKFFQHDFKHKTPTDLWAVFQNK